MNARLLLTALVCLGPGAAFAQRLTWLGPSGSISPDGCTLGLSKANADGSLAALQQPTFGAVGGVLRAVPSPSKVATFALMPNADAREVKVWAEEGGARAELRLPVGPPAARVGLTLSPAAPVKGRETNAELEIRLLRGDGTADVDSAPPVLVANVGRFEPPTLLSPGVFKARYHLPSTRYPEVAVLVAFSAWPHPQSIHGAFGSLRVPLASAIELPGRTEPGASMTLEIAGKSYPPTQADAEGRFRVPVVVPPGHRFGKGTAVDRHGNKRTSPIDLMLPPTDQLACVANPARLPADGSSRARVLCALSDPYGNSAPSARATLQAARGKVSAPRAVGDGVLEWIYTVPKGQTGSDVLTAAWREAGPLSRDELRVESVQGPASKLAARVSDLLVHAGASVDVSASVLDAADAPRAGASVEAVASAGTLLEASAVAGATERRFRYQPPADAQFGSAKLSLRAFGPAGSEPARLHAWMEGGALHAAVTDLAGLPVPKQPLLAGEQALQTGADGTVVIGPVRPGTVELRHARWNGLRLSVHVLPDLSAFPPSSPVRGPSAELEVRLAPAAPVNVRAEVRGREVTFWAEDERGQELAGRALSLAASAGEVSGPRVNGARQTVTLSGAGRASVSIADALTGVTALVEVAP